MIGYDGSYETVLSLKLGLKEKYSKLKSVIVHEPLFLCHSNEIKTTCIKVNENTNRLQKEIPQLLLRLTLLYCTTHNSSLFSGVKSRTPGIQSCRQNKGAQVI